MLGGMDKPHEWSWLVAQGIPHGGRHMSTTRAAMTCLGTRAKAWEGSPMICFAPLPYLASVACLGEPKRPAHSRSFQLAIPPVCCLPGRFSRTAPAELITCTADDRCAKPRAIKNVWP
jgi:hypothetical protein